MSATPAPAPAKAASEPSLLPCFRCKADAHIIAIESGFRPLCKGEKCYLVGAWCHTKQAAADWWNTRPADTPPAVLEAGATALVELGATRHTIRLYMAVLDEYRQQAGTLCIERDLDERLSTLEQELRRLAD